ncbi:hypothetical protein [Rheinheimera maricola]|uniref:Uncharacterized protein n=1 Tax=Rheinheimera maricola TaxID=2793282 RepID=A0ABS7XEQ5_9GAMM|nr:hypothetical protein [Rheinheimera maricola]MBZ9613806.1 hypothetical protein [Rheinheimera maricola]
MKTTLIKLLTCTAIFTTVAANATTEQGFVCHGCNYQQAKTLALSKSAPVPQCEGGSGSGYPTLETQICFSQVKKFVVFDSIGRQAYPFEVYHANQGGSISDLNSSLTTRDRSLLPAYVDLINTGVDMHSELMNSFNELGQRLMVDFEQQQLTRAHIVSGYSYNTSQASCENDADARAIDDAFDLAAIGQLQQNAEIIQREQTDTILDSLASYFDRNSLSLSSVSFTVVKGGLSVALDVDAKPKNHIFTVLYNSANDISVIGGRGVNAPGKPKLVYEVSTRSDGGMKALVNKDSSYISNGTSLSQITSGSNVTVSACVADAIMSNLPQLQFSTASGNGLGETPPSGTGGGSGGGSPENDCTRVLFGKANGTVVLVLTVNIC